RRSNLELGAMPVLQPVETGARRVERAAGQRGNHVDLRAPLDDGRSLALPPPILRGIGTEASAAVLLHVAKRVAKMRVREEAVPGLRLDLLRMVGREDHIVGGIASGRLL